MLRRFVIRLGALMFCATTLAACFFIEEDDEPTGVAADGRECFAENNQCDQCGLKACCTEYFKCEDGGDCLSLFKCVNTCTDGDTSATKRSECQASCGGQFPKGVDDFKSFGACVERSCESICAH